MVTNKSVYWRLNWSKDVQPPPLALKGQSEDVKGKDFCLYICLYVCIFCNMIIALLGVCKALIVFPKETGKKMWKTILASAQFFQPKKSSMHQLQNCNTDPHMISC